MVLVTPLCLSFILSFCSYFLSKACTQCNANVIAQTSCFYCMQNSFYILLFSSSSNGQPIYTTWLTQCFDGNIWSCPFQEEGFIDISWCVSNLLPTVKLEVAVLNETCHTFLVRETARLLQMEYRPLLLCVSCAFLSSCSVHPLALAREKWRLSSLKSQLPCSLFLRQHVAMTLPLLSKKLIDSR